MYKVYTEHYDFLGADGITRVEGWSASIFDAGDKGLINRDGDTESEAITIAFTELLGNLPSDFPRSLIDDAVPLERQQRIAAQDDPRGEADH